MFVQLGLQEAMAHYSGEEPVQDGRNWLDTLFGMGRRMFELVPGMSVLNLTGEIGD